MKLVRTVFEIELDDKKFSLRKPTFKESQKYREDLSKLGASEDASNVIMNHLESLGLPNGVFESLESDHITQLLEVISGLKKN